MASTPPPNTPGTEEAWSLKGFIHFVETLVKMVLDLLDVIVEPFFKINQTGRFVRSLLFVIGLFIWFIAAYTAHFPQLGNIEPWIALPATGNPSTDLMLQTLGLLQQLLQMVIALILPFFAPDIFRHVLVIGLAGWIAYQWAGIYLDDIFELKDTKISRKFIRGAAFVGPLEKVHIADGEVMARHKDSPVIRIGGPGKVVVHLENAALFEKINGEPHIILSDDKDTEVMLDGFERLRTVKSVSPKQPDGFAIFDRRDQFIGSQTASGRTKDGIVVTAKNISAVFSLHQGPVEIAETAIPQGNNGRVVVPQILSRLDFKRESLETAIKNLVYNQVNRPWTETAKQNIFPNIRIWIGQHTLDEFLTNLSPQELAEIREQVQSLAGQSPLPTVGPVYLSRAEITNFAQGLPENWPIRGYDVHWVGVGTWETPDEIPKQHKEALEMSVKNRIEGSELELSRIRRESRLAELFRLFQGVPINTFQESARSIHRKSSGSSGLFQILGNERVSENYFKSIMPPKDAAEVKYKLIVAYREKFKNARDWYERNQQTPPEELRKAIEHLSGFTPPA